MSVKQSPPPVLYGQYQDEWNTNQNRIKNKPPFYILLQVLKLPLINICKRNHQVFYFLLFCISFYISRYPFSQIIRTSLSIIWKKDRHKFSFFNGFTQPLPPHPTPPPLRPLSSRNLLSVTKVFWQCCLTNFSNVTSVCPKYIVHN